MRSLFLAFVRGLAREHVCAAVSPRRTRGSAGAKRQHSPGQRNADREEKNCSHNRSHRNQTVWHLCCASNCTNGLGQSEPRSRLRSPRRFIVKRSRSLMNTESNESHFDACIAACQDCIRACEICAAADIRHGETMADCALLCLDCADACVAAVNALARGSIHHAGFCRLCAHLCRACAAECAKHADEHEHCRLCHEACERCAVECEKHAQEPVV